MTAPVADRRLAQDDQRWLFGLFALLLALSLLLHQLWWDGFEVLSPHGLVVAAALWTMARPTSVVRFVAMLTAEVGAVALDMPGVGSHTLLVGVSGACILAWTASRARRSGRLPGPGALFEGIAPFLRVQLLVVYAAAAVAKMNSEFFDGATSCAPVMAARVAWFDPSLLAGSWLVAPAIWGTVAIEVALVVLLAVPRTRVPGLALGVAFHAVLALAGNVPFSALALALYVAFLPPEAPSRVRAAVARYPVLWSRARGLRRRRGSATAAGVAGCCWLVAAAVFSAEPAAGRELIASGTRLVVLAVALAAALLLGLCAAPGRPRARPRGSLRPGHVAFTVGIALLVANGLSPYLGLKTAASFTMFSNLRTEGERWNHAFIPEAVRVFGYQDRDRLVRITATDDPVLARRARGGALLVRYELERYLRKRPQASATFVAAGGGPPISAPATEAAGLSATALADKVARFNDVRPPGRGGC